MREKTTREILEEELRQRPGVRPTDLMWALDDRDIDANPGGIVDEIRHVDRSLSDESVKVSPPVCEACGYDNFDDQANIPSQCPECRSERIAEPLFTI